MRIAVKAGGRWPEIVTRLIGVDMAEDAAEREAGLKALPPGMVIMRDLHAVWPKGERFVPTRTLVSKLITYNPEYWGLASPPGKLLTDHKLARLVSQATKMTTSRPHALGPRGYLRVNLEPVWHRLGIGRIQTGTSGSTGTTGSTNADPAASADQAGRYETPPIELEPYCVGCGHYFATNGFHRPDCPVGNPTEAAR